MLYRFQLALVALFSMFALVICPSGAVQADYSFLTATGTLTSAASTPVILQGLSGQSSCDIEVSGTWTGALNTQGIVNSVWVSVPNTTLDNVTIASTITTDGTYTANCGSLSAFRVQAAGGFAGSATVSLVSSGGITRVLSSGVNGGKTTIVGSAPITVTNAGTTVTIGLTDPLPIMYGGTGATALPTGCLQSNGTAVISVACATSAPTVSVTSGNSNVSVATPSPGVFVISAVTPSPAPTGNITAGNGIGVSGTWPNITVANNGVISLVAGSNVALATSSPGIYTISAITPSPAPTAITALIAGTNIQPMTGYTPTVATTNAPTFIGTVTAGSVIDNFLSLSSCVGTDGTKQLTSSTSCITSVTGDGANITSTGGSTPIISITSAPTFGKVIDSGLTTGNCVQASTGGLLSTVAAACGTGTLTGITAGSNMVVGTGPSPTVAVTNAPGFVNVSASNAVLVNSNITGVSGLLLGTSGTGNNTGIGIGSTGSGGFTEFFTCTTGGIGCTTNTINGTGLEINQQSTQLCSFDNAGDVGCSGALHGTNLYASSLTSGQCVQTTTGGQLTTTGGACTSGTVTSVTGSGNIASTGGTTPVISFTGTLGTANGGTGTSSFNANRCLWSSSATTIVSTGGMCAGGVTTASFVAPAVGSTVSVSISTSSSFALPNVDVPIIISDGTTTMSGIVTAGQGTTTITVQATNYLAGTSGNTVASPARIDTGGSGYQPIAGSGNISVTAPVTGAAPTVSITNAPTFTGTITSRSNSVPYLAGSGANSTATHIEQGAVNGITVPTLGCSSGNAVTYTTAYTTMNAPVATLSNGPINGLSVEIGSVSNTGFTLYVCNALSGSTTGNVFWHTVGY